ncbi:translesion DNA synthesis-associated protein ImuA [Vibrio maerlii]|uniref:translesion DNA synthesis-associated protein ImuA n=1 Tax=Vibrio maerlii TaxID=2231648 RepID=UPI000E3B689E|nr:translesion DNA synthesis-associated protein ImuA [Vibrio maerlii]
MSLHSVSDTPSSIKVLQQQNLLWSANRAPAQQVLNSTGFSDLDEKLQGGFPTHGVVEIASEAGIGELRLLMPYLKQESEERLCVLINPPADVNGHAFLEQGINYNNIVIIEEQDFNAALWAAEQSLKSGCCGAVLLWQQELEIHQAKRLQVASEHGKCLQFVMKKPQANALSLPISLSLALSPDQEGIRVSITKRKGGFSRSSFVVSMGQYWPRLTSQVIEAQSAQIVAFPAPHKRYAH